MVVFTSGIIDFPTPLVSSEAVSSEAVSSEAGWGHTVGVLRNQTREPWGEILGAGAVSSVPPARRPGGSVGWGAVDPARARLPWWWVWFGCGVVV
jgi:hypothetical protein